MVDAPAEWDLDDARCLQAAPAIGFLAADLEDDPHDLAARYRHHVRPHEYTLVVENGVRLLTGPAGGGCAMTSRELNERVGGFRENKKEVFWLASRLVVVSYNSRDRLRSCVEPLLLLPSDVIVVDNASPDPSLEVVDDLSLKAIQLRRNGGFAHGVNAGWRAGTGRYVLLLNPDARIDGDSLRALVDVLDEEPSVGAVAPRIVHDRRLARPLATPLSAPQVDVRAALFLHRLFPEATGPTSSFATRTPMRDAGRPTGFRAPASSCGAKRSRSWTGCDEGFFMYGEDIDLCRRLRSAGYELVFEPAAVVEHEGGASAPRANLLPVLAASRLRYAAKHRDGPARSWSGSGSPSRRYARRCEPRRTAARAGHARALPDGHAAAST